MIDVDMLLANGGVLVGSRALGVADDVTSDYDIAILEKDYDACCPLLKQNYAETEISKYMSLLPLGNSGLLRGYKVDIIIFTEESDLKIVIKSLEDMKKIPKYLIKSKYNRCMLFEDSLQHYGFKRSSPDLDFPL